MIHSLHRARADAAVEAERELVPVERRPLQALAAALAHARGDRRQQRPADAGAAMLGRTNRSSSQIPCIARKLEKVGKNSA